MNQNTFHENPTTPIMRDENLAYAWKKSYAVINANAALSNAINMNIQHYPTPRLYEIKKLIDKMAIEIKTLDDLIYDYMGDYKSRGTS